MAANYKLKILYFVGFCIWFYALSFTSRVISELIDIAVSSTCQLALPFDSGKYMWDVIRVFMCCLKDMPVWSICQTLLTTCFWGVTRGSSVIALSSSTALSEVL
jgi:hypothetical protein